ncbi:MAG TPA: hypothetical protein VKV26_13995 [Dehalococcoidia bacterium]|nr:hypothetical protein [Dehalococcoidia bacterium]
MSLAMLPVQELAWHCRMQHDRYHRGQAHDDGYANELVRRAVIARDEIAWEALYTIYNCQVAAWCRRAGAPPAELEDLCAAAWLKFWHAFTVDRLCRAKDIRAVLKYLMLCATSVVIDAKRKAACAARFASDLEPEQAERLLAVECGSEPDWHDFWRRVQASLHSEADRVLVQLAYERELKSAEIQAARPDLFPTVEDVYRTRHAIFDRLRRNTALRRWFECGGCGETEETATAGVTT